MTNKNSTERQGKKMTFKNNKFFMCRKHTDKYKYMLQVSFWLLRRNQIVNINYKKNQFMQFEWIYSKNIDKSQLDEVLRYKTLIAFNIKTLKLHKAKDLFLNALFKIKMFLFPKKRTEVEEFQKRLKEVYLRVRMDKTKSA